MEIFFCIPSSLVNFIAWLVPNKARGKLLSLPYAVLFSCNVFFRRLELYTLHNQSLYCIPFIRKIIFLIFIFFSVGFMGMLSILSGASPRCQFILKRWAVDFLSPLSCGMNLNLSGTDVLEILSGKPGFSKKQADLFFPPDFADDFPVSMQV